jgi:DNA-binding HxlR family transcriptional regulator
MAKTIPRSHCPISFALDFFGDKWSLLIVRDLLFRRKRTYREFLEGPEGIATNILADRLKKLAAAGIIEKRTDRAGAGKGSYALTDKGRDLLPLLLEMAVWSSKHDPDTIASAESVVAIQRDRNAVVERVLARLDEPGTG